MLAMLATILMSEGPVWTPNTRGGGGRESPSLLSWWETGKLVLTECVIYAWHWLLGTCKYVTDSVRWCNQFPRRNVWYNLSPSPWLKKWECQETLPREGKETKGSYCRWLPGHICKCRQQHQKLHHLVRFCAQNICCMIFTISGPRNCNFRTIFGPRNCNFRTISGPRNCTWRTIAGVFKKAEDLTEFDYKWDGHHSNDCFRLLPSYFPSPFRFERFYSVSLKG